jgi:crotonobetainyl-CoA:carnitine CoA-transferase CaiB-like acyl-CoA transferase
VLPLSGITAVTLEQAVAAPFATRQLADGPFGTRDGHTILIAIQNEAEWARFCRVFLAAPDVSADQRFRTNTLRVANRAALDKRIGERFGEVDAARPGSCSMRPRSPAPGSTRCRSSCSTRY